MNAGAEYPEEVPNPDGRSPSPEKWGAPVSRKVGKPRISLKSGGDRLLGEPRGIRGRVVTAIPLRDKEIAREESLRDAKARRQNFRAVFEAGIKG